LSLSYQVVSAQALVALVVAATFLLLGAADEALGALLGGLSSAAPGAYFAWQASRTRSPQRLLAMGVGKFLSTCVLLAMAIAVFRVPPLGLFLALGLGQLAYVVVPLLAGGRDESRGGSG
jgi:F0F1-type ATP synthase assembly protein I